MFLKEPINTGLVTKKAIVGCAIGIFILMSFGSILDMDLSVPCKYVTMDVNGTNTQDCAYSEIKTEYWRPDGKDIERKRWATDGSYSNTTATITLRDSNTILQFHDSQYHILEFNSTYTIPEWVHTMKQHELMNVTFGIIALAGLFFGAAVLISMQAVFKY